MKKLVKCKTIFKNKNSYKFLKLTSKFMEKMTQIKLFIIKK